MTDKKLSPALVRRLPAYFRTLIRLYGEGKQRISSEELSSELGLAPSQIRSDMKSIGCQGQRSYGYGIPTLYKKIADILQLSDKYGAVVIGDGHLASAISESQIFSKRGMKLLCRFSDESSDGKDLTPFADFEKECLSLKADIIIAAGSIESAKNALSMCEIMHPECGIFEFWNFTDAHLSSEKLKVKNIHLSDQLMLLTLEIGDQSEITN